MSEIKPVGHLVTEFGGDACLVTNEKKIQILAEMGWPIVTVYDESALAQARAEMKERCVEIAAKWRRKHSTGSGFDSQPARETAACIEESIRALTDTDERTEK